MIKKQIKKNIFLILILLITILFFIQFFDSKLPAHDILTSYFSWAETLKVSKNDYNDMWPLWNPYGFSGTPFMMKPILGYDSLFGLMLLVIPSTVLAVKLTYVFFFMLSGITMYFFMIYLKLDRRFAFISALVYMLNGHVSSKLLPWGWLTTLSGYSLIPLLFLFGTKAIREKEWVKNSIITAVIFALMLRFGPDMKVGLWVGLVFGLYLMFNLALNFSAKKVIKCALVAGLIILIFFGLSAQRIITAEDYISKSSRAQTSWERASGRQLKLTDIPEKLIEPGLPDIKREGSGDQIGIIAFLLAAFAIYKKRKNKIVLFFALTALFSVIVANNTFNIYYLLWKYIPFFESMRYMNRSLFIFAFAGSILAGIGANEFFKNIHRKKNIFYVCLIALILANLWLFNYGHYASALDEWHDPVDAIENNHILQYISKQQGLFRIQTWETHGIDWGTDFYNVPLKLEHIYKYDSMWYPPYFNVYLAIANNNPPKFWGILNVKYITAMDKLNISGFKFIKEFEKCKVCYPETEQLERAYGPYLYENENFLPRAFIVDNAILVVGEEDAVTQTIYGLMLNQKFNPSNIVIVKGRKRVNDYNLNELKKYKALFLAKDSVDMNSEFILKNYVDSGGVLLPDLTKNKNTVTKEELDELLNSFDSPLTPIPDENVIMHNFDKREIKLNKNYKGFLVIGEKFSVFPGWKAKADGIKQNILNANSMVTSIYLNGDENNLVFEYKPRSHVIGSYITLITLVLVIGYFVYNVINNKRPKK